MNEFHPKNLARLIMNLDNYTPDEIETIILIKNVNKGFNAKEFFNLF